MSRTYRKYPYGIESVDAARDGHGWHAPKDTTKHVKRYTNRLARREWLTSRELRKERARLNMALT